MYGWRGRIGLIVPASNTSCEPEMSKLCPEGIAVIATRISFSPTLAGLKAMLGEVSEAAELLAAEGNSDVIAFCCTVGSILEGKGYDELVISEIKERTGILATTTGTAVAQALNHLQVRRVGVVTPYTEDINQVEKRALESLGFSVESIETLYDERSCGPFSNMVIAGFSGEQVYRLAKSLGSADVDGLLISCTNLRCVDIVRFLEADIGKPVVTSNQAAMWAALRLLGVRPYVPGFGKLLAENGG